MNAKRVARTVAVASLVMCFYVKMEWPEKEQESLIPPGKIEESNFFGERVKIIKFADGIFLVKYPTGIPAKRYD